MSRASRQIVTELNKYADIAHVQGFLIPAHIYVCDYMIIKYSTAAVLNIIKSQMGKIPPKRREYKHFTPIYWYKVVDDMLGGKQGARRNEDVTVYGEMNDYNAFNHITKIYLIDDYSVQDAMIINRVVNTYELADIVQACKVSAQNGAHSMAYVDVVLKDINARKKAEQLRIQLLGNKIDKSSMIIDNETHTHTPIELAQAEYNYNKKREDVLLELLLGKMFGGDKK